MKTNSHAVKQERSLIDRILESLLALFMKLKVIKETVQSLKAELQLMIEANGHFEEMLRDHAQNVRQYLLLLALAVCYCIDFCLLNNAISILTMQTGMVGVARPVFPILVVTIEVVIGYFTIQRIYRGDTLGWLSRNLQYLVLVLLVGLSALVVFYAVQGYSPGAAGNSPLMYYISTIVVQVLLLIFGILLHLWIINHSEDIADAAFYATYKMRRNRLARKTAKLEQEAREKHWTKLVTLVHQFAMRMEQFKRKYPDEDISQIERSTPADLTNVINTTMGKEFLKSGRPDKTKELEDEQLK